MAKDLVKRSTLLLLLLASAAASADNTRVVSENRGTEDSEDARQRAHYLGYLWQPSGSALQDKVGLWLGRWTFDDPLGSEDFDAYRLSYEAALSQRTEFKARAAVLAGDDWSPTTGQLAVIHLPSERWRLEAAFERDLIDTVPAIRQELTSDSYSVSADYVINPRWTLVGALLHQDIDDGNRRDGGVLRVIYSSLALPGATVQLKSRLIDSDFDGAGYFSPPKLAEHLLLLGYATTLANERWRLSVSAGPGRQQFEDAAGDQTRNSLYYAELKARGWFTDSLGLEGHAFCSNTGGPNSGAPDDNYRYCGALLSLLAAW